ncbi:hypothetical protein B0T18DRAFT_425847 [Schizothecium vesticola]|uniref:DUF202 domain-containing protein n=1 Tax=Schizothecium vesticola TaxID=314040 RepID=A0AA40F4K5_9PEZI|nr:hypothetical protein B0T18DRAFT_425847 [Schizothecium vesticola]
MPRRKPIPNFVTGDVEDSHASSTGFIASFIRPVDVQQVTDDDVDGSAFCLPPLFGPLIFDNENSDCRDHCANERSWPAPFPYTNPRLTSISAFLSYLRLSIYMAIVSVAIILSFHLRKTATEIELRMARPLGAIFWILSVACLGVGMANYINTVNKYSRRAALVQTGWKTQSVMATVALCIVGSCITLLVINKLNERADASSQSKRFVLSINFL